MSKYFLIKMDPHPTTDSDLDASDLADCLNDHFEDDIFNLHEIDESDITQEPASIDQGGSVELGRRRINLRKTKTYSIPIGGTCKIRLLQGPTMLIEDITFQKNQSPIAKDTKEVEVAQCVWFNNNVMNRAVFKTADLEVIEAINDSQLSTMSRVIKQHPAVLQEILDGQKINAIKKVREITGLGLKEAKDLVESVSPFDIERWKQGIYK